MISRKNILKICSADTRHKLTEILDERENNLQSLIYKDLRDVFHRYENTEEGSAELSTNGRFVDISFKDNSQFNKEELTSDLLKVKPWRKGPFLWRGIELEAEWDSYLKWQRLEKAIGPIWGKKVCDVGCNNGYYMLRMSEQNPEYLLGIDPTARFYYQYKILTAGLSLPMNDFQLLGVEHLTFFPKTFDVILYLGILYHHSDPIGQLKLLKGSLRKGGKVIVEVQGIDDENEVSLFPHKRYAKAPGVWFLPSVSCLKNMMHRAGFRNIECISSEKTSFTEQRNTEFCPRPLETLVDFLDKDDPSKTVEGYPAPFRHMLVAE